jgi:hypothetical protein
MAEFSDGAAGEGSRRSRVSVLIRDEWRLQRGIWSWVALPIILAITLAANVIPHLSEAARHRIPDIALPVLLVLGAALTALLGGNSFAALSQEQ